MVIRTQTELYMRVKKLERLKTQLMDTEAELSGAKKIELGYTVVLGTSKLS